MYARLLSPAQGSGTGVRLRERFVPEALFFWLQEHVWEHAQGARADEQETSGSRSRSVGAARLRSQMVGDACGAPRDGTSIACQAAEKKRLASP